jgi:divinyl protochlorophyllide a 8-vinyl-reductase
VVQIFGTAQLSYLLDNPPEYMVDQAIAARLHDTLRRALPAQDARAIAAEAGRRTADYLLAHRIPKPAQLAMKLLPPQWAARILLKAMAANAWTYAGTEHVRTEAGKLCVLEIIDNPLAQPLCPWHVAVFERLFRVLVAKGVNVSHAACCAQGAPSCRFDITLSRKVT